MERCDHVDVIPPFSCGDSDTLSACALCAHINLTPLFGHGNISSTPPSSEPQSCIQDLHWKHVSLKSSLPTCFPQMQESIVVSDCVLNANAHKETSPRHYMCPLPFPRWCPWTPIALDPPYNVTLDFGIPGKLLASAWERRFWLKIICIVIGLKLRVLVTSHRERCPCLLQGTQVHICFGRLWGQDRIRDVDHLSHVTQNCLITEKSSLHGATPP